MPLRSYDGNTVCTILCSAQRLVPTKLLDNHILCSWVKGGPARKTLNDTTIKSRSLVWVIQSRLKNFNEELSATMAKFMFDLAGDGFKGHRLIAYELFSQPTSQLRDFVAAHVKNKIHVNGSTWQRVRIAGHRTSHQVGDPISFNASITIATASGDHI